MAALTVIGGPNFIRVALYVLASPVPVVASTVVLLAGTVAILGVAGIYALRAVWVVDRDGIKLPIGPDIRWVRVRLATIRRIWGFEYLRVTDDRGSRFTVILTLPRGKAFRDSVAAYVAALGDRRSGRAR